MCEEYQAGREMRLEKEVSFSLGCFFSSFIIFLHAFVDTLFDSSKRVERSDVMMDLSAIF